MKLGTLVIFEALNQAISNLQAQPTEKVSLEMWESIQKYVRQVNI